MTRFVDRTMTTPHGSTVRYRAFSPIGLAERDLTVSDRTQAEVEAAAATISASSASSISWEPLARILLRSEGVASSSIEQLQVPTQELVVAALGQPTETPGWILANIDVIELAATSVDDLTWDTVCRWHSLLMQGSQLRPEHIGATRDVQNWIGGPDPAWAVFVPPPPEMLNDLIGDLLRYANRTDLPAIVQAAILHGQFETIHPFVDGNGRIGRALVLWCLARRGLARAIIPPISPIIAADSDAYLAGLYDFREGDLDRWVAWFANVCRRSGALLSRVEKRLSDVLEGWRVQLADVRSDSAAHRILPFLAGSGALDVDTAARQLGVSRQTARTAMSILEAKGIVERATVATGQVGRPPIAWVAPAITEIITDASLRSGRF